MSVNTPGLIPINMKFMPFRFINFHYLTIFTQSFRIFQGRFHFLNLFNPLSMSKLSPFAKYTPSVAYSPIEQHYPGAIDSQVLIDKFLRYVGRQYQLGPEKIMHADSICSDDINNIQYPPNEDPMLGPFVLGGLDGFPFTGLTGMNAFAHHVPEGGALFIYYSPHIGISKRGTVGKIRRPGQTKESACCGAAQGALDKLTKNQIVPCDLNALDYQQNTIEQLLLFQRERIVRASQPMIAATDVMYEGIRSRVKLLVEKTKFECQYVFMIGGILINSDGTTGSFVQVRNIEKLTVADRKVTDIKGAVMRAFKTL